MSIEISTISISALERETGLSKDKLRKWEERYGFPQPTRRANGDRFYTSSDLKRLLIVKRLLDNGLRPTHVVALELDELQALSEKTNCPQPHGAHDKLLGNVWRALHLPSQELLKQHIYRSLKSSGLRVFVLDILPMLNQMVGDGWANGTLAVHQEHLYSEAIRTLLLEAIGPVLPLPGYPKILLSTPPGERHDLGMLMLQSILTLDGSHCISLGTETPAAELVAAAQSHKAEVIALSFSIAFPVRSVGPFLEQIRTGLPESTEVWAGGASVDRIRRKLPGIRTFATLEDAAAAATAYFNEEEPVQ